MQTPRGAEPPRARASAQENLQRALGFGDRVEFELRNALRTPCLPARVRGLQDRRWRCAASMVPCSVTRNWRCATRGRRDFTTFNLSRCTAAFLNAPTAMFEGGTPLHYQLLDFLREGGRSSADTQLAARAPRPAGKKG